MRRTALAPIGIAHDLTFGVDVKCETAIIPVEGSEIDHGAILPEKSEESLIVFVGGSADNLSSIIDPHSLARVDWTADNAAIVQRFANRSRI